MPASIQPLPRSLPKGLSLWHLLNIPNLLTLCRVFSIPIFLAFLSKDRFDSAFYIFCAAALTDSLDGTVARWFDCRTELGTYLDPFADKLLLLSAFVALTVMRALPHVRDGSAYAGRRKMATRLERPALPDCRGDGGVGRALRVSRTLVAELARA